MSRASNQELEQYIKDILMQARFGRENRENGENGGEDYEVMERDHSGEKAARIIDLLSAVIVKILSSNDKYSNLYVHLYYQLMFFYSLSKEEKEDYFSAQSVMSSFLTEMTSIVRKYVSYMRAETDSVLKADVEIWLVDLFQKLESGRLSLETVDELDMLEKFSDTDEKEYLLRDLVDSDVERVEEIPHNVVNFVINLLANYWTRIEERQREAIVHKGYDADDPNFIEETYNYNIELMSSLISIFFNTFLSNFEVIDNKLSDLFSKGSQAWGIATSIIVNLEEDGRFDEFEYNIEILKGKMRQLNRQNR